MKATILVDGKPIAEVEPFTPIRGELKYKPELTWKIKGTDNTGGYRIEANGEMVKPSYVGQTGIIELTNGELIEFIAIKKEAC